ncbi:MAG: RluA family pseudouridine synthase [Saprospiraceae bacterium]|nr:RluA family pseudouridine synthase [Saprospiraceae bacterium]
MPLIDIIFEDDHLVIVNKAAGMLTVADRFQQESVHLQSLLRKKYTEIYTIHRLDRDTSGLLVFAKDAETHRQLSEKFEHRDVKKVYFAMVEGTAPAEGTIDEPLALSESKPGTMKVHKKGKPSLTTFTCLQHYGLFSTLEVHLHTGRMHQIRVHLVHIGIPLFIDPVYGRRSEFRLSELKGKKYRAGKFSDEEKPLISRLTLHSWKLSFDHPATGKAMHFEAPLPKDMRALINQAEKWKRD